MGTTTLTLVANGVVAMTAVTTAQFPSGKLFAATSDNRLWARDPALANIGWQLIGHANGVLDPTAAAFFASTTPGRSPRPAHDPQEATP
jgi:hypothetical protein